MYPKTLALALALTSAVSAGPLNRREDPCQVTYKSCVASGVPEVACACDLQTCLGEDNARGREYCASATATISCDESYSSTVATPVPTTESCDEVYPSTTATPVATSIPSAVPVPSGSNPVKSDKSWAVNNLNRYCSEDNSSCDYNFVIEADGKTERCTVDRMPGKDAATESWSNQPCTSGSPYTISWGYITEPAPAFAVMTVVDGKELAWFGVSDVNGQKVTPSNPFGSGQYANLTAPVYTYN
ncbi:hypothetical protein EJ07DRAFT_43428, partial [Lizonia empirigonia]